MGCCFSTTTKSPQTNHHRLPESDFNGRDPPPPPPAFEEETVKEVLSETPISKPKVPSPTVIEQVMIVEPTVSIKPIEEKEVVSEVSEVSEMFSLSESFSTTTVNEKRDDDDGEVTQRSPVKIPRKRPYSGELVGVKQRGVRSPARRSAPSPEKRSRPTARPGSGRAMTTQRKVVGSPNATCRDPGEGSARRSRSPVTRGEAGPRRNAGYRSPAAKTTIRPGGSSPVRTVENDGGANIDKPHDDVSPEKGESLENPLVSLECFIFL